MKVSVIGAGLAGCEAAFQLANQGIQVDLYEMKPQKYTAAHTYQGFAELVCSNSLKAARLDSAAGLLKAEMRELGSLVLEAAEQCAVAAGGALAVDREKFSDYITNKIKTHENINVISGEVTTIPQGYVVIASGPLTSDQLADTIMEMLDSNRLSFFDAAAPIVTAESIDMSIAFAQSRYGKGDDDYINCPMNKEEYELFYTELIQAESAPLKEIDKRDFKVYEGCMPIEVMAKRGADTIRFGPLKPVGLRDPRTDHRPWAVVQLRKENQDSTMYNLVGFQTNLKFGEQKRVFSLIPGLQNAEFVRYGVMHRNTFIDSPRLLDNHFCLKKDNRIFFAGQITGVEGYTESAASGIYVGYNLARIINGKEPITLPKETMLGSLSHYISDETVVNFQPMGSNMGILPSLETTIRDKKLRYETLAKRAIEALKQTINQ
ncbi:methylenetetrahydrofolate--tRNA-(uracil(54)-C(5))-methyltransferase (FADH(2)-oxidizing) TrmFO [Paludicola sp. MB14-C6]|uniref:methylenetetrahydrofolate--tRNA-(uracil(54)- C(5))-methyltransferase (FADH(2)-oxidizing) TrmFO n=1 Tax=Paludihabitans sp. MB14-C6 TaxID=3070656 RepID=UPI0027DB0CA0|nr:methylenetetrahydrofolate--tRNA-(uracil(54)-C(5))-methyltransferase (FADH(2)-oxidizing) TrmFO [Paludicola sp. MB14-C6]WMJ23687.1 methylenetetrahydrofolate--tRNA-(uracil(54)-C(5))-methyltransferase (FADH(2)-oxidizing) TrmFO [Paludicola sp. MB14-C6]